MATLKGSDNKFPKVALRLIDDTPATPAAGLGNLVAGVDKVLRWIDDDGLVTELGGTPAELDDIGDVNITSVANGDVLTWDSTPGEWVNLPPAAAAAARGAKVYHSTTQSLSDSTDAAVTYDSEDFDTNTNHGAGNPTRIVLNAVGKWRLTATHVFAANATGARFGYFKVNGTAVRGKVKSPAASSGETWINYTTTVVASAITDYAEAWAIQNSGGSLNLAADSTFEAIYIGS